MFTGIIQSQGRVVERKGLSLVIDGAMKRIRVGDSVAVNGVCLTVVRLARTGRQWRMWFDLSQETLDRTTLGEWGSGRCVNLEPALRAGDPMGGHIVQGHVDGMGRLLSRRAKGGWTLITVGFPKPFQPYFVHKGSVSVDGISLTVLNPHRGRFDVAVIPHTERVTTLGQTQVGDAVNVEADMIAKQVAALVAPRRKR